MTTQDRDFLLQVAIATTSNSAHNAISDEIKRLGNLLPNPDAPALSNDDRRFLMDVCQASPAPATALIDAAANVLGMEAARTVAAARAADAAAKAAADAAKAAATAPAAPEAFGGTTPA